MLPSQAPNPSSTSDTPDLSGTQPPGFDLSGAARDLEARARRYAPIYAAADVGDCVRLLHRNPSIAPVIRRAIEREMAVLPGGGVGLDAALFPPSKGT